MGICLFLHKETVTEHSLGELVTSQELVGMGRKDSGLGGRRSTLSIHLWV